MMRFAALVLFFICLFSVSGYSQNSNPSGSPEKGTQSPEGPRIKLLKADILKEIRNFPKNDQARFYARLGRDYWETGNREEGLLWLSRGVELGTNPATEYENDAAKLADYWGLLNDVLERDAALTTKLITKIRGIEPDESNDELRGDANRTYIVIASQMLTRKKDDNLALEFALLSLKGRKPAINWTAAEFFRPLKAKNEPLADLYFAKLVESVKNNGDQGLAAELVNYFTNDDLSNYPTKDARFRISEAQKKELLEILIPFIQKDSEYFIAKKINGCGIPAMWGGRFSEDYKKMLPEKAPLVELALVPCANREREPWEKTELYKKPNKTIEELLELAKLIPDKQIQASYVLSAVSKARNEKKWSRANEILDGMDKDFRNYFWISLKIETVSNLIIEQFYNKEQPEAAKSLENSPPELRPFIIVRILPRLNPPGVRPEEVLNLLNIARADFNKLDRYPANPWERLTNPTHFASLLPIYVKFRYYEEAVATQEEAIKAFNRLVANLPAESRKKYDVVPCLSSFSRFTNQFPRNDKEFIDRYFDRIYANIGQIEQDRNRLSERLNLLRSVLEKPQQFRPYPLMSYPE